LINGDLRLLNRELTYLDNTCATDSLLINKARSSLTVEGCPQSVTTTSSENTLAAVEAFTSHNKSFKRESLGISTVSMGTSSPLSQGQPIKAFETISYSLVQPSQTMKLQPRLRKVKAQETKTSDPVVTRSLPGEDSYEKLLQLVS
jgi:hypothetical protein